MINVDVFGVEIVLKRETSNRLILSRNSANLAIYTYSVFNIVEEKIESVFSYSGSLGPERYKSLSENTIKIGDNEELTFKLSEHFASSQ